MTITTARCLICRDHYAPSDEDDDLCYACATTRPAIEDEGVCMNCGGDLPSVDHPVQFCSLECSQQAYAEIVQYAGVPES